MRQGKTRRIVRDAPDVEIPISVDAPPRDAIVVRTDTQIRKLGRYRIGAELATGGMATVHLAVLSEGSFEKVVALKCIHPHLAKETRFVEMFLDEARIASHVSHPHVVQIFDFGEEAGSYFLAMEYLPGLPLARVLQAVNARSVRTDPVSRSMLLRIAIDVAGGLHAIHDLESTSGEPLGVVHRDVSPQNILVTVDGVAKLIDLGIARAADQLHRTATHEIKGNLPYIAPEVLRGEAVDRRADVWSLGVVVWEAMTGERLFKRGSAAETLFAVANDLVRRADAVEPSLPRRVGDVIARALERDRERRHGTARDFARELEEVARELGPVPTTSDLADWLERLFPDARAELAQIVGDTRSAIATASSRDRERRTRRRLAWLGGAIALAVAVGVTAAIAISIGPPPARLAAIDEPVTPPIDEPVPAVEAPSPPENTPPELAPPIDVPADEPRVQRERRPSKVRENAMAAREENAAPQAPGRVTIVTPDGWADVYSDGRRLGPTPLATTLPAGTHTLVLRPFGREPSKRIRVEIEPGGTTRRSVRLN
jgi:serine/threonine-protein kinase